MPSQHQNYVQIFTDDLNVDEKFADAAVSSVAPNNPFSCRLRDHCSIYTAELKQSYLLSNRHTNLKKINSWFSPIRYLLCKRCKKVKTNYPLLAQIQNMLHAIDVDQKEIAFMWVPGHACIRGNEAADRAALDKEPTDDLMLFSDLKPMTAKYIHQVWQKEWDEAATVFNKRHEILPKLPNKLLSFCKTRKKDTIPNRLHIDHS